MKHNENSDGLSSEESDYIRTLLKKQFKNAQGYIDIAIGEALTSISTDGIKHNNDKLGLIYTIAKNKMLNELKRRKKFEILDQSRKNEPPEFTVVSPEKEVLGDMTEQEMLSRLSQKQRIVAILREQGLSIEEIAEKEHISKNAVKERLKAIRKKLKKYL